MSFSMIQMTAIGIRARRSRRPPKTMSLMRLVIFALPMSGVTRTRMAGVLPTSSSSPICEVKVAVDGTK